MVLWLKLKNFNFESKNQARSARLGGGADLDSICKEIDAEDVGAMT